MHPTDILVIGAGIAGAATAAELAAAGRRVLLLEAESQPGFHSTGRSAALWILNYGPADVRALTGASRAFFEDPPPGFAEHPLTRRRPVLFLAPDAQRGHLEQMIAEGEGLRPIGVAEVRAMVPILRADYAAAAAIEEDAFDIDVHALHQGYLRMLRAHGGRLATEARAQAIERRDGAWRVTTPAGTFAAPIVVNAAGAWGDEVAQMAGLAPLGLTPMRRTALLVDAPAGHDPAKWPLLGDADHTWYARPEARRKIMLSPADETPMPPCDVQPDELDLALAIDRAQAALDLPVSRIEHRWAGLRTFTPDRSLAIGWAGDAEGFLWMVGQGGYGIQTAPAAARLARDIVLGRAPEVARMVDPRRFTGGPQGPPDPP
ncbi:FAD-binding oxidoreductase [Elioraea sp.]|uniref:NAD(P)/FAD-dependent oxidoreductase n=1 Tax=Elioraea sp. TaxID=2185103 RepID=UPI0021DC0ED8|nr:FAD-binding oxidoreductase [Elioraea sp.]GIX08803.1 MAG: FAD-dependent catabolic D-arginine dehydrogenase DauA [Elioraea sp.]